LCARAERRRRSAGLTYFLFPLGFVADRRALDDFDDVVFFDPVCALPDPVTFFFFVWLAVDADALVDLAFGAASRFPSTGVTAIRAHRAAASSRAGARIGTRERTGYIASMYDGFGSSEHQRITTVTYPVISGTPAFPPEILIGSPKPFYYT